LQERELSEVIPTLCNVGLLQVFHDHDGRAAPVARVEATFASPTPSSLVAFFDIDEYLKRDNLSHISNYRDEGKPLGRANCSAWSISRKFNGSRHNN
jgi:hypothetical protein